MKITWLGQSGYIFESAGKRLLIDPFYSDIVEQLEGIKRLSYPPVAIADLRPDFIFITHGHIDHFDPVALPQIHHRFPDAKIIGPPSVMRKARELDFDEAALVPVSPQQFGPFRVQSTPAYHTDEYAVGCLLACEGLLIYISGDTLLAPTLAAEIKALAAKPPDMMFIVINGRLGNMNLQEAVQLVTALRPRLAIPMHYGMFAENTADPVEFCTACQAAGTDCHMLTLENPFNTAFDLKK